MVQVVTDITVPNKILGKGIVYVALLLATMVLLLGVSLWLYNQQAEKANFLHQQQVPFIKNNAQLMKSVAELENQLVAQQLAISHQQLAQPLENVKQAWLEIVDLSRNHILMVNDSLRDNAADEIAVTAQQYAEGYKEFVILVDDLLLTRQSRVGQYAANSATLAEIIGNVNRLKNNKQTELKQTSFDFVNSNNRLGTEQFNQMLSLNSEVQLYQHIYQELLKIQNQLTSLSSQVTAHKLNQISSQIASLTKNINEEMNNRSAGKEFKSISDDIIDISNQFMGSGQLFAKWQTENTLVTQILNELTNYQLFLRKTAGLIQSSDFYDLPEFKLVLPIINVKVNESTLTPIGFLFVVVLFSTSAFLAWRLIVLIKVSYLRGAEFVKEDYRQELQAEQAIKQAEERHKLQLDNIMKLEEPVAQDESVKSEEDSGELQPSFYKMNGLVMDIEKYNQYHGSAEMAVFMLEDYVGRNETNLEKLKQAVHHKNLVKIDHIQKAILKTANILSAPRMLKACEHIKLACEQGKVDLCPPLVIELEEAMQEVKDYVCEMS